MEWQRNLGFAAALALSMVSGETLAPSHAEVSRSELVPLADFARGPQFQAAAISPDGRRVATIEMVDGRAAIHVRPVGEGLGQLVYRNANRSISNVAWSPDGRFLLTLQDSGGDEGYHLFKIDPSIPGRAVDLTPFKGVTADLIRTSGQSSGRVAVSLNRRDPQYSDAYSLDVATGALTLQVENPSRFTDYFADRGGQVVAASSITPAGDLEVWSLNGGPSNWRRRYVAPVTARFKALAVVPDGSELVARTDQDRDTERLIAIPLNGDGAKPLRLSELCARYDVTDVIVGLSGIDGSTCASVKIEIDAIESSLASAVTAVRRLSGADSNVTLESRSHDGGTVMFFVDKGDRPGRFFLKVSGQPARLFAETRPWLTGRALATPMARWVKARDGLPLLTYITRLAPFRRPGPTVIAIHGGPWTRDTGGYEGETQLLASRGYTVIQVNFRGSTGLGRKTYEGGIGEFGGKMSDDIDDVFHWAVRTNIADPNRTCVLGGSYGGFAALTALTRTTMG